MMKTFYGGRAQRDNEDWGFSLLPKWDKPYDVHNIEMMIKVKSMAISAKALTL